MHGWTVNYAFRIMYLVRKLSFSITDLQINYFLFLGIIIVCEGGGDLHHVLSAVLIHTFDLFDYFLY